ncbi:MAG: hypothetical protein ACFCUU_12825 [Cyclobacteriaceae bacterium]
MISNLFSLLIALVVVWQAPCKLRDGLYLVDSFGTCELTLHGSNETYRFGDEPIVTQKNFQQYQRVGANTASNYGIRIKLDHEGTEKIRDLTQSHIGERVGIIVKGRLVTAPIIEAEITDGEIMISGDLIDAELRRFEKDF